VVRLEPEARRLIVGPRPSTLCAEIRVKDMSWLAAPAGGLRVRVKHRAREAAALATVHPLDDGRAHIVFDQAQSGVAPGQAAVLYQGTRVLGGGFIDEAPLIGADGLNP
jgi:tRNA-specific 2-thiouridylase